MDSRSVQDLCCTTQSTLFNVCLAEGDLGRLGRWAECPNRLGFSPAVWWRASLHRAGQRDASVARRVTDLLDLRHVDTIVLVRGLPRKQLEQAVDRWLVQPDGEALAGLLWALCTDARPEVHALGVRLCHEAVTVACRELVETSSPVRKENAR